MTKIVKGDLFDLKWDFEALGHGVNCRGLMGAGIAPTFKALYPSMHTRYVYLCENDRLTPGGLFPWYSHKDERWIYNIASQDKPGRDARLEWLRTGLQNVAGHMLRHDVTTLGLPFIGAGIGGLTQQQTYDTVSAVFDPTGLDVTIVEWNK